MLARGSVLLVLLWTETCSALVSLKTTARIPNRSKSDVFDYLATPSNWPKIVLSSWSVQGDATDSALGPRDAVDEVFGLPPLVPLRVRWTCVRSDSKRGVLEVVSPQGVIGLARDCRMLFNLSQSSSNDEWSVQVDLTVEYQPANVLGYLAIPILTSENAFALNILLPSVLEDTDSKLNEFRRLMGSLYGVAGVAHALDCWVGPSTLLTSFGGPGFYELPPIGQAAVVLWCLVGPLALATSRVGGPCADLGLILYGVVEVAGAAALVNSFDAVEATVFVNAAVVQGVVAMSWLYSSR